MFTAEQIKTLLELDRDGLTATPDRKYALYKFTRDDKIEIRLEESYKRETTSRYQNSIGYMDTILKIFISKEEDVFDTIYRLLRNCLLVERIR
jgi:hypothetical protein